MGLHFLPVTHATRFQNVLCIFSLPQVLGDTKTTETQMIAGIDSVATTFVLNSSWVRRKKMFIIHKVYCNRLEALYGWSFLIGTGQMSHNFSSVLKLADRFMKTPFSSNYGVPWLLNPWPRPQAAEEY